MGDTVLRLVAQRLDEQVRSEDMICRYGGDEFLYLLVNPQNPHNIQLIADKVCDRISQPLIIDDLELTIGQAWVLRCVPMTVTRPQNWS